MTLKAFDLLPVIEKVTVGVNQAQVHTLIEALECCGRHLYIGTSDSYVIRYVLDEKLVVDADCIVITSQKEKGTLIHNVKKPVAQLKAVSALNRLVCLCDNILIVLDMYNLQVMPSLSKLRGISSFCLNENPSDNNPFTVQVCIARKNKIHLCILTEDKIQMNREFPIPESPLAMAMDGKFICIAMSQHYAVMDCDTGNLQDLCDYDSSSSVPFIRRITKEEFLLNGPGALGIFVTSAGISERPPMPWSSESEVISVAYSHPYILALSNDFLSVYSIVDQKVKQKIAFFGGSQLGNFDGRILVSSPDIICALVPVPWQRQVDGLLSDKKVEEALELARYSNRGAMPEEQFKQIFRTIQQRCGFIKLSQFEFSQARELFLNGQLDVRELISLYSNLLSTKSTFVRCQQPPLHEIPNVNELCQDESDLKKFKDFLLMYLEDIRNNVTDMERRIDLDTALLNLYAENHSNSLFDFVLKATCDVKETESILLQNKQYHALAICCQKRGETEKALQLWNKLLTGALQDEFFPGIAFLITFLTNLNDYNLLWKYSEVVLDLDEEQGVKIFTDRGDIYETASNPEQGLKAESVVNFLQRYNVAVLKLLENLIYERKFKKEKFHTHLAVLYLDKVIALSKETQLDCSKMKTARQHLQRFLKFSKNYRIQLILGKVSEHKLDFESAILYGKLEDHDKALRILVHKLNDYASAETYCAENSAGREIKYKQKLFHTLLGVYLDPTLDSHSKEVLLEPAIKLLNSDVVEFDTAKVLQLLPSDWSVNVLDKFLHRSLRLNTHRYRTSHVEQALARQKTIQFQFQKFHYSSGIVSLTEDRLCTVCHKAFTEPVFAWYPNSLVTHVHCARNFRCPVSGRTFSGPPPQPNDKWTDNGEHNPP